jgi:hypothetical protein
LGIQRQQPSQHVIPHGIGPVVAPGQFAAAADGAVDLQLALEIEGACGIPEEQLAAVDVLLQLIGELGVFVGVEIVETEAAGLVSDGSWKRL